MMTPVFFDGPARIARVRDQFARAKRRRRETWEIFLANNRNRRRLPRHFPAIDLGPLPVELVNRVLQRALAPGIVYFSSANQDHAFGRHSKDFLSCLPHVAAAVLYPEYIGQSPRHPEGFEMVRGVPGLSEIGDYLLVALTLEIDEQERYIIQSVYPIPHDTVRSRLRRRHLFQVGEPVTTKAPP